MNNLDEKVLKRAKERWQEKAKEAEYNAGMEGRYDDGGCTHMLQLLSAFEHGLRGEVPSFLSSTYKQVENEMDPEYEKYLELKKKFEEEA